ncbi:hypothetical protein HYH02_015508, partial [Chlamydomonas schloesseri]
AEAEALTALAASTGGMWAAAAGWLMRRC